MSVQPKQAIKIHITAYYRLKDIRISAKIEQQPQLLLMLELQFQNFICLSQTKFYKDYSQQVLGINIRKPVMQFLTGNLLQLLT